MIQQPLKPDASALPAQIPEVLLSFRPFTTAHAVTWLVCVLAIFAVVQLGRRMAWELSTSERACDPGGRMLGVLGLANWFCVQAWWNIPVRFDLEVSLPLQICDLVGPIAALALITGKRWLTTLTYFWGFGLSTQAFLTPVVKVGPIFAEYWLFWETHTFLIGAAVYVVAVRGYRPMLGDLLFAAACLTAYVFTLLPFNIAFGLNYGFLGETKPENPTLIDKVGPWPWRLFPMAGLAFAAMAVTWVPWAIAGRASATRGASPGLGPSAGD